MISREINCKSLMNKSMIGDYCINPYVGCRHACSYCYAESITKRFSSHKEPWGEFVDVKINALDVLKKELLRKKKGLVYISSLTDAYQPSEKKHQLTRKILQLLLKFQFPISIQTKSSLVTRDIDLIKQFDEVEIGFTITGLDDEVRKNFEPNSSSVKEKLEAIKKLKENGIKVYVFFGPILPYLSDKNLERFFQVMKELKVDYLMIDKMNLKHEVWKKLESFLNKKYPELVPKWKDALFKKDYYESLRRKIKKLCEEYKLRCDFCY